jgi:hypothetical protein
VCSFFWYITCSDWTRLRYFPIWVYDLDPLCLTLTPSVNNFPNFFFIFWNKTLDSITTWNFMKKKWRSVWKLFDWKKRHSLCLTFYIFMFYFIWRGWWLRCVHTQSWCLSGKSVSPRLWRCSFSERLVLTQGY